MEVAVELLFSDLPTELYDLVFDNLDIEDIFNLSLTSRSFWSVGRKHIHTYFMSFLGPWAGESIVSVGENVKAGDYPPGMFTEDEENTLSQEKDEEGNLKTLEYFGREEYAESVKVSLPYTLFKRLLVGKGYNCMASSDRSHVMDTISPEPERFFPRNQSWILRNLTTKEFIRSEAIALKPEHIHGPNIDFLGFGEVVLSRICWSTDPSVSMDYDGSIHRGIWAGHCFDITTLARHT